MNSTQDSGSGQTELITKISQMPKVELHIHLEGAIRLPTLQELTMKLDKSSTPKDKKHFVMDTPDSLTECLEKFWAIQRVLNSYDAIERITYECIEDRHKANIKIVEIRYSPAFICVNHDHLTFEGIHQAVLRGVERAAKDFPNILVGIILIVDRNKSVEEAQKVAKFAIENKSTIVGVDMANDEIKHPPEKFAAVFEEIHKNGISITIHSGEVNIPEAPKNVRVSVTDLHATRIGHGIFCINDDSVVKFLIEKGIVLEVCPYSNWLTNACKTLAEHPLPKLLKAGVKVTISTDDPGLFGHDINTEYLQIVENGLMTLEQLKEANEIAYKSSFIPESLKKKFWNSS